MFLWFPVLDLARAPRRTARKKGSGYEIDASLVYVAMVMHYKLGVDIFIYLFSFAN
jgi:hypothetical protein